MYAIETQNSLLGQLRENETRNSNRFKAAGFTGPIKSVRCPKCGLYESIVFWTPDGRRPNDMRFRCPRGCKTRIRYDPVAEAADTGKDLLSPSIARWILLPVFLYVVAGYVTGTPWGQGIASRMWRSSQAQITYLTSVIIDPSNGIGPTAGSPPAGE